MGGQRKQALVVREPAAGRRPDAASSRRALSELELDASSPNTERSQSTAQRYWSIWHQLRYGKRLPLPVPAAVIVQFILDHAQRTERGGKRGSLKTEMPPAVERELIRLRVKKPGPYSLATIVHRVAMISRINRDHLGDRPNPASAPPVRKALETLRLAYAKRDAASPRQMPALTVEPLHALLRVLEADVANPADTWTYLRGLRDRALLLFAFNTGGRRRSEVTGALRERLKAKRDGTYKYLMGATKTTKGPEAEDQRERPVKGQAAKAMRAWLEEARIQEGPLFPHITRKGKITDRALAPESVRNLVVRLSAAAGVDEAFSAHSLRSGYMTEASHRGIPLAEAMGFSGHRSHDSAMRYYRSTKKEDSPAADLFE